MTSEPTKPIAEGSNMAVEMSSVAPETEHTAAQDEEARAREEEEAAKPRRLRVVIIATLAELERVRRDGRRILAERDFAAI